jgi:hypothetical protein
MIVSALPSIRCSPLVPGLQPQSKSRIVNAQIPVRAAQNRLGFHRGDFLRHDPNKRRVAPEVPIAIEIDAAVEFSELGDIAFQTNIGFWEYNARSSPAARRSAQGSAPAALFDRRRQALPVIPRRSLRLRADGSPRAVPGRGGARAQRRGRFTPRTPGLEKNPPPWLGCRVPLIESKGICHLKCALSRSKYWRASARAIAIFKNTSGL